MVRTTIEIDTSDVVERTADHRGRVRLGPDLAGKEVEVVVLSTDGEESAERGAQEA